MRTQRRRRISSSRSIDERALQLTHELSNADDSCFWFELTMISDAV